MSQPPRLLPASIARVRIIGPIQQSSRPGAQFDYDQKSPPREQAEAQVNAAIEQICEQLFEEEAPPEAISAELLHTMGWMHLYAELGKLPQQVHAWELD